MKAKSGLSIRIRVMFYTVISLMAAAFADLLLLLFCLKTSWLVVDYTKMLPPAAAGKYISNNTMADMIANSDFLYRIFGVGFKWQLWMILSVNICVVFIIVFLTLTWKMTKNIGAMLTSVKKMSEGDFEHRVNIQTKDELGLIAYSINEMADKVEKMQKQAVQAEKSKNELITNVAHDLRTPLTSVIGYVDLVRKNDDLTEQQKKKYLNIAWEKAMKLEKLIEELFQFTKVSYGNMPMKKQKIDIMRLLEQEIDELYPVFEENHLICSFEADRESCMVEGDGEQLARLFDNLLGNAIRYGKDGKMIKVYTETDINEIKVFILNYGSIIPKENIPFIFDKFYKVDSSRQADSTGTGLGLSIAKSIVVSHGGTIRAESSFNGTIFEVRLPLQFYENNTKEEMAN